MRESSGGWKYTFGEPRISTKIALNSIRRSSAGVKSGAWLGLGAMVHTSRREDETGPLEFDRSHFPKDPALVDNVLDVREVPQRKRVGDNTNATRKSHVIVHLVGIFMRYRFVEVLPVIVTLYDAIRPNTGYKFTGYTVPDFPIKACHFDPISDQAHASPVKLHSSFSELAKWLPAAGTALTLRVWPSVRVTGAAVVSVASVSAFL